MERLLDLFSPTHYNINLYFDKHAGTAHGEVSVEGAPKASTVKFHAVNLHIKEVYLETENLKSSQNLEKATPIHFETNNEEVIIEKLPINQDVRISFVYDFEINTNMQGAYLSKYMVDDQEHLLVSTQFESHYARECFPCIDEPAAKATFSLTLTTPDLEDTILANTPAKSVVKNTTEKEAKVWQSENPHQLPADITPDEYISQTAVFEPTPKMSTYLLAFCIGELKGKSRTSVHGVKVTTYCTLNHPTNSVDYANEVAARALDYYDDKFGIKYPLDKLDQVAIPEFEAGAMENWGLVTYRESCLLANKTVSKETKQSIAITITHELSHQWFGDLVTMKWWDNLWLNESFASIMEYVCVDALYPDYNIWQDFYTGECRAALMRDSLPGVQAVQQDVTSPAEIATLFDGAIVYAKGAHLMFMLYRLMGDKAFFNGLKDYFKKYQYSNTVGDDLWACLQKYADFEVKDFMDAWILQPGYPVITDGVQQRFLSTGDTDDSKWPLPKITDDMSGHYIINLSSQEFTNKLDNFEQLSMEQKIRLLIDRTLLSRTPIVSAASLLDIAPKFVNETSNSVWDAVAALIADLKFYFPALDPDFPKFQEYVAKIVRPGLNRLGLLPKKNESDDDMKLRQTLIGFSLYADDVDVVAELAELYDDDFEKMHPEIRYYILNAKFKAEEEANFADYLNRYKSENDPEVKSELLSVISDAKHHTDELLGLLKDPKTIKPQDHLYLFIYMARSPYTHTAAVKWLYNNWDYIVEMVGEKSIEDYPRYLSGTIRTKAEAEQYEKFFAPMSDNPVLARTLEVAKAEIETRLNRLESDNKAVHQHLIDYYI